MIGSPPNRSTVLDSTGRMGRDWLQWALNVTNTVNALVKGTSISIPGPYANDTAAAGAGVSVGSPYYISTGFVVVRQV